VIIVYLFDCLKIDCSLPSICAREDWKVKIDAENIPRSKLGASMLTVFLTISLFIPNKQYKKSICGKLTNYQRVYFLLIRKMEQNPQKERR